MLVPYSFQIQPVAVGIKHSEEAPSTRYPISLWFSGTLGELGYWAEFESGYPPFQTSYEVHTAVHKFDHKDDGGTCEGCVKENSLSQLQRVVSERSDVTRQTHRTCF